MKKRVFALILCIICFSTGCFSYTDINKVMFVTSIIIDVDKDNKVVLYLETFKPFRASSKDSAKGQRIIFKGTGKTVYEVMKDINLSSSYQLDYTQNNVIIFTERAAQFGLDNFLDVLDRNQQLLIRPYVLVYSGDPEKLIKSELKEEEYIGIYLHDLIENQKNSARTVQMKLSNVMIKRLIGSKTYIVSLLRFSKDQPDTKLAVDGGAIIKEDKLISLIRKADGEKYNFLMNNINGGTLEPSNPMHQDKFVSMEILKSDTKTNLTYDGKTIHLNKIINTKVAISDVQKSITLNPEMREKLKANTENNIKKLCTDLFNYYKKKDIDIFCISEQFKRKYPHEKLKDEISKTELDLQVVVDFGDTEDTTNFQ